MGFYNVINPGSMQAGQPEDVSQVLANLQAIAAVLNGGIDNANIVAGAGIDYSKLALALQIKNADINDTAAILGHKLNWSKSTSPPGSPQDGDIWIYPFAGTAYTQACYQMYIYDSSEATYKWKFVGGSAMQAYEGATINSSGSGLIGSPSLTVPRAGVYLISASMNSHILISAPNTIVNWGMNVRDASLNIYGGNAENWFQSPTSSQQVAANFSWSNVPTTIPAGTVLKIYVAVFGWDVGTQNRSISVTPVKVS